MRWAVATGDGDKVGLFSFLSPTLTLLVRGHGTEARKTRANDGVGDAAPAAYLYNKNGKANRQNPKRRMNLAHLLRNQRKPPRLLPFFSITA
jgi:hypothetical protein